MTDTVPLNEIYGSRVTSGVRVFGAPHRYVQGPDALTLLRPWARSLGARTVLFFDPFLRTICSAFFSEAERDPNLTLVAVEGDVTYEHIERLVAAAREGTAADVVVGFGGGKVLDLARAVSHELSASFITVPSIASNDSPAAMAVAVYDDDHRMVEVIQTTRNPDVVLVDTRLIASAPVDFLIAGIGDAVAKKFEARACRDSGGLTQHGARPLRSASVLADACYATLRETAVRALEAARSNRVTEDLEDTIEAVVLMAGLGFENGGLSIAHSIVRGLQRIPGAERRLHGAHVAYGLLVQRALEGASEAELADLMEFLRAVGLPIRLADLGAYEAGDAEIEVLTQQCLASPHVGKTTAVATRESLREAILRVESAAERN